MKAFIFPGQGSQQVGMLSALASTSDQTRRLLDTANEILGYDLAKLCFEGPADELTDTRHAQPALLVAGVAYARMASDKGLSPAMVAGHSLGEYSALVAAGVLSFEDALRLVQRRAQLMSAAPTGAMAAIVGLPDSEVEKVAADVQSFGTLVAANFNAPGQVVISGEVAAVEAAMREAKTVGAKIAIKLPVSGAFHSPLMEEAALQMSALIDEAQFAAAQVPVYQNATAQAATQPDELKAALKAQMTGPVRWVETMQNMVGDGATHFYELGPGKVLCGLLKRIDKSVVVESGDSII
jgi:[acyl-carrier-protein] S-malonyltransferase